jgi:mono/diheme cytochrome c family protein/glucose/arabinose dehydrogenase
VARLTVVLVLLTAVVTLHGQLRSPVNRPWPAPVHDVPDLSPPLSPAEALTTFHMPPGYRLELVASEPLVQDPVAVDWDPLGRLWVVEMPGYMRDIAAGGEHDPVGRVVVLQDRDRDGRMDRRTVFADGLVMARAVKVLERGVLVGEPPDLWLMRDADGDLKADTRERVTNRYGRREIDPQNNANALHWALDNRLHTAGQAAILLRPGTSRLDVEPTVARGQWGVAEDDAGRIYRNTNESALHVDLVPTPYYARHPGLLRTRGSYERLATANPDLNVVWPIRPNPGTNRAYQFGIDRPDGTLARFTAVCAPVVYKGDRLPGDLYGNVLVAEPAANVVSRLVVDEDATGVRARRAYPRGEFLASTDERFRPVYLANAPDGTLYIVDLYRGLLEHRLSLTEYLRDQALKRNLVAPTGLGRIYRVVHETTTRDMATGVAKAGPADLVALLSHPNGWWRDTAQRLIIERSSPVARPLAALAAGAADWRLRLRALWTLDGLGALGAADIERALGDASPHVRRSALRLSERWLVEPGHPLQALALARLDDPDAGVRRQLAATIGALPPGARETAAADVLARHGGDPIVVDATLSGVRGMEHAVLDRVMLPAGDGSPARESAIAMLAATILRGGEESRARAVLDLAAEAGRPAWQRAALVHGAEIALAGAAMPGTPPPPAPVAGEPCPTCPGGRAGPGGAYAYARPLAPPARPAGATLRLTRAPEPFLRFAAGGDPLGARAAALLARVTWPGKPGAADAAPLTAREQERFDAGREVYRNYCQACHQADGRGQDRLAPSLVESPLALAEASVPVRVLLHGKEGATGLMPPVGGTLGDDQIAAVLTYIRREWGQAGAPVDADTVRVVRARTAARTRPWTDAELQGSLPPR